MKVSRTESPQPERSEQIPTKAAAVAAALAAGDGGSFGGGEGRKGEIYKLRSFWDTASRGLTTFVTPKPHFRTNPSDHGKASSNIAP
ncbi:hypothetical protein F511_29716 [Dorcoceras hygrometricum]|uniref:Uncharacterized protein n=1 Tax=Dorcoceras hygrometricum TaxID=472368 RepID=A0A2Z7CV35_9LAMI|nr:hypothetical protein F511_29716 [Dorcoceras hygrometricum]